MAVNTKPTQFESYYDPETQSMVDYTYSYDPNHLGRMGYVNPGADPELNPGTYDWIPSKFDLSNAKKIGLNEYVMPNGDYVQIDIPSDSLLAYIPNSPTNFYTNQAGQKVGFTAGPVTFQGQSISPDSGFAAEYSAHLVDPNTNQYIRKANGALSDLPYDYGNGNGFTNFMAENGWMLPLAMGAGAAAGAAMGAGAGAAEVGAGAAGAELAGPTYAELGYTGLAEGMAGPTYAELGYTGLNNAEAIAAADAASKGLTGAEALKYINQARQGLGLASALSKLAGGGGTGGSAGSLDLGKLANMLAPKNTYQGLELAQITPKNPFLFTTPGQTQATEGAYDVSGSNMANALRKKNYGIG